MYPENYRYTKEHEWLDVVDGVGTIGITDFAQSELGDVVFLELPEVGRELQKGESFGAVESVKAVSDLFCPVTGKVTEINSALVDDPEKLNEDPHSGAWLIKLTIGDEKELEGLMTAAEYEAFIKG